MVILQKILITEVMSAFPYMGEGEGEGRGKGGGQLQRSELHISHSAIIVQVVCYSRWKRSRLSSRHTVDSTAT